MGLIFNHNFVSFFAKINGFNCFYKSSQLFAFFGIFCFQLNSNLYIMRYNPIVINLIFNACDAAQLLHNFCSITAGWYGGNDSGDNKCLVGKGSTSKQDKSYADSVANESPPLTAATFLHAVLPRC